MTYEHKKKIYVTHLTIRFYKKDGWTENEVRMYLVDKTMSIIFREDLEYWAVYERSGFQVFVPELEWENDVVDNYGDLKWYIKK